MERPCSILTKIPSHVPDPLQPTRTWMVINPQTYVSWYYCPATIVLQVYLLSSTESDSNKCRSSYFLLLLDILMWWNFERGKISLKDLKEEQTNKTIKESLWRDHKSMSHSHKHNFLSQIPRIQIITRNILTVEIQEINNFWTFFNILTKNTPVITLVHKKVPGLA